MKVFFNHIKVQLKKENPLIYSINIQNIRLSMITLPKTKVAHNILRNHSLLLLIYGNILIYNILIYSNIV